MKKIVIIFTLIVACAFTVKAQNSNPPNDYFLPDFIDVENCGLVEFNSVEDTWLFLARGHHYFITTGLGGIYPNSSVEGYIPGVLDRAQPCYTDTLLTVIGVAIGVNRFASGIGSLTKFTFINPLDQGSLDITYQENLNLYNSIQKGKLKLMNATLDREIISIDIDTNFTYANTPNCTYLEYYFSNPVNVNGLFYIVEDAANISTRLSYVMFTKDCYFEYPSLVRTAEDTIETPWMEWVQHPYNNIYYLQTPEIIFGTYQYWSNGLAPIPNTCQMYFFPIFAETDSTLGDGINFDTNDSTDMSLYDATVDRCSFVSPNPANDVVTVQSSFKIREIEIHNTLGQVVLRKEGGQNIETIDVSNLQSGAYIVRIKTQRGFANKKILIE
ncbi:MAG: T9SS type A sorting domain-containing protein [Bacteroidales bacterium]|nr:T9SS type A sorting domain-containing protein [Bacteroidales bacterium]